MQTFEEAVANFTAPDAAPLAALKQTFEPTLAELRDLQRCIFPKKKAGWLPRVARVEARYQQALSRGVYHPRVAEGLEELRGGRPLHGGVIPSTETQITRAITNIERLSGRDLPKRNVWLSLYSEPQKVRDNMRAIEEGLAKLEDIVRDGGELQGMIAAKSGQSASSIVPAQPQHERPAQVPVEMDFPV